MNRRGEGNVLVASPCDQVALRLLATGGGGLCWGLGAPMSSLGNDYLALTASQACQMSPSEAKIFIVEIREYYIPILCRFIISVLV